MAIDADYTITPLSGSGIQIQYSADEETWHATFTDGDVYMRQKVDGGDWTDPIKIVGEDGKNAIAMTSATTPSGEYEGQVGIWQNQIYFWTNGEWVNQTPELPTDAVLHYSFDEVPDIPDGTADVKYLNGNTYNLTTVNYNGTVTTDPYVAGDNKIHKSNINGNANYKSDISQSRERGVYFTWTPYIGQIVIFEFELKSDNLRPLFNYRTEQGGAVSTIYPLGNTALSKGRHKLVSLLPSTWYSVDLAMYATSTGDYTEFEILNLYIGNGSYSTPIIDNANGQNNAVNNGGIAVQGVSGKGAYITNKTTVIPNFNLTPNFAVSLWVKPDNATSAQNGNILVKWNHFILRNGDSSSNYLRVYIYYPDGTNSIINPRTLLPANVWTHVAVSRNGTNCDVYINGEKISSTTLAYDTIRTPTDNMNIGWTNNTCYQTIDDLLIFDRALSETEVQALYQNKANTPKYFTMSDYSLKQIDDDNVVDHLTEKPQLLSKWLEIYNAKNVSSALPTSNVSTNGEYKGVINTANEVGVISTEQLENYIQATNALRSALWGTNGYLVDMNTDSTLNGNLDTLFANYRETLQIARTQITQQQASIASALSVINSNPFQLIPVDSQGEVITGGYDNTGTRLQVYNGTTVLTPKSASSTLSNGEWKVTANGSGIVAGSQTVGTGDDKYIDFGNVSNLSAETAVITYTINVMLNNTPNTIYVVQKFGKSKEGADGRIYTLLPDFTAVKKSADGSLLTPSSVTVQAKSWTGSSIPEPYNDGDLKAFENNVQVGTTVHGNSITVTPTGNYPVVVNLYRHGTNTLIDTVTIPILQEVKGDTGRGLVSSVEKYKLSASFTEPFNESTASSWTDTASSVPTAQLPYLHHAVLQTYSEAPLNEYGDDVIIREYVTNGTNGTSTRYSSVSATSSTTSIALNTITGNTAVVGDVIIANSLLFVVTAVGSTNATVQYKQSIKGADNKSVTVLLSNQNPNVTSNSDGTSPVLTNTVTDIRVYENETELKYDASSTSNGYYKVTVTVSGCTHSSITDKGDYAQVNAISAMSADNATRTFAISGKRSDGTTFSFSAVQTITKSKKGNKGDTGVGITAVTEYYLRNNSSTTPAFNESTLSNWSTTASNPISTAQYLWNAERITKSDGTTTTYEYMTPHLAMKYTANGKGIVNIKNYYLATSLDSGVTTDTQGWTEAVQTVSSTNRYLWNYEEITYTTGNPTKTSPAIIGTFGAVSQGNWTASHSYKVSDIVYYQGSSYICKTAHTSGSTFDSSKWNKLADKGGDGKGVVSVIAYTALSQNTTKPAESEFTTTAKSVDSTNRYLWRYEVTTYTDDSTTGSYADATIIGVWGDSGIDATSVSISSEQIEVMCGSGNGKFLGQQTQKITVYARKGSAKKACTLSFTSPASGTGITITKQNGTASVDGYFNITFADNGNLGGDSTNSFDLSLTVTVDTVPFVFTVKAVKASKGVYLGRCTSKPSTATVTVYTGDTWNGSSVTKYALKGDYVSVVNMTESDSNRGKMFQWNGLSWNEDGNTGHAMEALDDMLLMADKIPDGSDAIKFIRRLVVAEEFLHKLFVNKIKLMNENDNIGAIYGGKYNADGSIDTEATTDKGVYLDADGEFKASNGQFSGTVQSENYIDADTIHFSYIKYRAWYGYRGTYQTGWYDTPAEAKASIPSEGTFIYCEVMFYDENDNALVTDGKILTTEATDQKGYIYQTDEVITQEQANIEINKSDHSIRSDNPIQVYAEYIWIKHINSQGTEYIFKCFCQSAVNGYRLSEDGKVDLNGEVNINGHETVKGETTFDGDIEINGVERVNGHIEIQNSQYDTTKKNYIGVCSKNYNNDTCTGFNFGATNSNFYADVNHMNVRTLNGWKTANETYSKITFNADNFAFNGQRIYTNITANSYSPSSSSSQRSALFNKIASIYDKVDGGYTHLGFMFGYNQSGTQQVIFSGSIYRIEKVSSTTYRVHIYSEFGQTQENYLAVTSSSCIIRTEVSGSQVSSSVSTVKFVSIN